MQQHIQGRLVTPLRGNFPNAGYKHIADPFYERINTNRIGTYQRYLDALFTVIDVDNFTRWASSENYDKEKLDRQDRLMRRLFTEDASNRGLSPDYLHTMINQYFFADPWIRERYKRSWAETVIYRRRAKNFFLNGMSVQARIGGNADETKEE